jgi:hypothetical protein
LSSASNVLLTFVVARVSSRSEFGCFALAFALYLILLSQSRAFATDSMLVRSAGIVTRSGRREAVGGAAGTAVMVGAIGMVVFETAALVCWHAKGTAGAAAPFFATFGVAAPVLMLQDAWRNVYFSRRVPHWAALNDGLWTALFVCGIVGLHITGRTSAPLLVLFWGVGAGLGALAGWIHLSIAPSVRLARSWLSENRHLCFRYSADNLLGAGVLQIATYVVGLAAGLVATGAVRGAITLVGLFTTVLVGVNSFLLPWFVHRRSAGFNRLSRLAPVIGAAVSLAAVAFGLLIAVLPTSVGTALLGRTWETARPLLLAAVVWTVGLAMSQSPSAAVRAMQLASAGLRVRIVTSVLTVAGATAGSLVGGARGAMWGLAGAALAGAALWSVAALVLEHGHPAVLPADAPAPGPASGPASGGIVAQG